ncbi:hypothetical protein UlMin_045020 [Ulmus minor]
MEIQSCGKPIESLLENVLCMSILSSDYFKELYRLKTYHEVIDEIYNQAKYSCNFFFHKVMFLVYRVCLQLCNNEHYLIILPTIKR